MLVWPPIPLQPEDDGSDRKFAHSTEVGLADDDRARGLELGGDERVVGRAARERIRAGGRRHAGRVDVVLDDDRDPEERPVVAVASGLVSGACLRERRRADGDHRVELRVQLADAPEIEVRQLDGVHAPRVHQVLELRDRRRVDVDAGDLRVRRVRREADRRGGAGHPEQECQQGRQDQGSSNATAHHT